MLYRSSSPGAEDTCHFTGTFGVLKGNAWCRQYLLVLRLDLGPPQRVVELLGAQGLHRAGYRVREGIVSAWTIALER